MRFANNSGKPLSFRFLGKQYKVPVGGTVDFADVYGPTLLARGLPLSPETPCAPAPSVAQVRQMEKEAAAKAAAEAPKKKRGRPRKNAPRDIIIGEDDPLDIDM